MNLAICSVGELFGGVERQILDICSFFVSKGHPSPVVILFFDRELADGLRRAGVEPVILKGTNRYDPRVIQSLASLLEDRDVDVVHAHGYKATIACCLAKRKRSFGLVKTEHGKVEANPRRPLSWLKSRLNFQLEQFLTRKFVDGVCYVTDDIKHYFSSHHKGLDRRTIRNGIEPLAASDFQRPADLSPDEIHLGIVGRVSEVKGIPVAIEALLKLPDPGKIRLNIIGTGKLMKVLQAEVAKSALANRVSFLGFRRNVFDYLAHLDVLLMPSYHEGLPYSLLEAMSLSRPIVVSSVGGLKEVVRHGYNGLLCSAGDSQALASCLENLLEDQSLRCRLGRNARLDQVENYTLEKMGSQYTQVYRKVFAQDLNGGG